MALSLRASERAGLGVQRASRAHVKGKGVPGWVEGAMGGDHCTGWSQLLGGFPEGSQLGARACSLPDSGSVTGSKTTMWGTWVFPLELWTKEVQSLGESEF